jgi:hypothetical protein
VIFWRALEVSVQTSRVAAIARGLAVLAALLFVGGPLAIQIGALAPYVGFRGFMLGGLIGIVALLLGLLGLFLTRPAAGGSGRGAALTAVGIGGAILAVILATAGPTASVPPINDITTDLANPPAFDRVLTLDANAGRDMGYPSEFVEQQRAGYPDLAPIPIPGEPPPRVLDRAEQAARDFGWEIVGRDDAKGTLELSETSRIFHFVDDVVIRAQPSKGGSILDIRSKSRDGRSDLGANAARIERLAAALAPQ